MTAYGHGVECRDSITCGVNGIIGGSMRKIKEF